jgi:hypothetical protein
MPTITTKDGTQIHYNDWGSGQALVFSHGSQRRGVCIQSEDPFCRRCIYELKGEIEESARLVKVLGRLIFGAIN